MGRIKAKPDGTATANVVITGSIEKSIASPIVIGIKSATTAVLLMASGQEDCNKRYHHN